MTGEALGPPNHGHPMVPGVYGIFPCANGEWLAVVGVVGPLRPKFYDVIGRPDLSTDPRFAAPILWGDAKLALFEEIATATRSQPRDHWCALLRAAELRYAPVRDHAEVVDDPQVWANGYLAEGTDSAGTAQRIVGVPIWFSETPAVPGGPAPELGAHTEEVLVELGYEWDEILALRDAGSI